VKRSRPTFEDACRTYLYRFTMEHVPQWARKPRPDGKHYAPQYASDREWFDNTKFPGEPGHIGRITECFAMNASWPLGQSLEEQYQRGTQL
jgi:hypothetical protein